MSPPVGLLGIAIRDVASLDEEDELVARGCCCSGRWRLHAERVVPVDGHWLYELLVACSDCGSLLPMAFDVTTFFEPRPGVSTGIQRRLGAHPRVDRLAAAA